MKKEFEVYLSPPYLSGKENALFDKALGSGWIAPFGPQLEEFESKIAALCDVPFALATQSGTSALHLALLLAGTGPGQEVLCPTFSFAALPSMISLTGASPVFIDADRDNWNMSLTLTEKYLRGASKAGKIPRAVVLVHNYGIMADAAAFMELCDHYNVALIEDAAEAFGSENGQKAGGFGHFGVLSFNGNKLITTAGGGALLLHTKEDYERAKKLALQSKEAETYYEHHSPGFNYRMNNVAAAFGLAQLEDLKWRIARKKEIAAIYQQELEGIAGLQVSEHSGDVRWLTAILLKVEWHGLYEALAEKGYESRPVWKPLHQQKAFQHCKTIEGEVAEGLFKTGLCLPSGLQLSQLQQSEVCEIVKDYLAQSVRKPKVL